MNEIVLNKNGKRSHFVNDRRKLIHPFQKNKSKLLVALLAIILCTMQVHSQTFTVLKNETEGEGINIRANINYGQDDGNPQLIKLDDEFLYGVFSNGGNGYGTIYKIKSDGTEFTILKYMDYGSGGEPRGKLTYTDGYLYGTARHGGSDDIGTIFKIKPDGTDFTVVFNFSYSSGIYPTGTLAVDADGYLYGTTMQGGSNFSGNLFKIKTDGTDFSSLLSFDDATGYAPNGALTLGTDGYLYGTTRGVGPSGGGAVYKIKTDGNDFSIIKALSEDETGGTPTGNLALDADGYLFGTCTSSRIHGWGGGGTIYKLKNDGTDFSLLKEFINVTENGIPCGGMTIGSDNYLYGTTISGGTSGGGTIFKISKTGNFEVLKNLDEEAEGRGLGNLLEDNNTGLFYGFTSSGYYSGTIFSFKPEESNNTAPVITSNNGTDITSIDMFENVKHVTNVTAADAENNTLTYSIQPSADDRFFTINSSTGELSFIDAPDYENPQGSNGTSQYNVVVRVTDNGAPELHDDQVMYINVNNADELIYTSVTDNTPCPGTMFVVRGSLTGEFEGQLYDFQAQLSDADGSFNSPLLIGSTTTDLFGSNPSVFIQAMLPYTVTNGAGYKIRIVSSTLAYSSVETEENIQILKARLGADKTVSKCIGSSIDLTGIFRNNGDTHEWNTNNPQAVTQPGRYTVIATSANGCQVRANVEVADVTKPDLGKDTVVKISGGTVDLTTLYNTAGFNVKWNTGTPTAAGAGRYRLVVSNSGCKDTASVKVAIFHSQNRGANDQSIFASLNKTSSNDGKLNISVYPNPARSSSKLQVSGSDKGYSVVLSDLSGKTIWKTENIHFAVLSLPVDRIAAGIYTVTVNNGTEIKTVRLVKE